MTDQTNTRPAHKATGQFSLIVIGCVKKLFLTLIMLKNAEVQ